MKLDICLAVPGMKFDGDTIKTESLGGSETAAVYVARELARRGHHLVVFSNCEKPGKFDGVLYRNLADWAAYAAWNPFDVALVQRVPEMFVTRLASRLNVLWCHDMALRRQSQAFASTAWNWDRLVTVSDWMRDEYRRVHGLGEEVTAIPNGIDPTLFKFPRDLPRDPKRLVFSARPERGLDVLLSEIMPRILKEDPEVRLSVYGYANYPDHMREFYAQCRAAGDALGAGVVDWGGHLTKVELARRYARAGVYVYPTPSPTMPKFREVSCISAIEAQAAGLPFVSMAAGALPETLSPAAGTLVEIGDYDGMARAVLDFVRDDKLRAAAGDAGRARATELTWEKAAEKWENLFVSEIEKNNSSPIRLARHFVRHSDIVAAKKVLEHLDSPEADVVRADISEHYSFMDSEEKIRAHYQVQHDHYAPLMVQRDDAGLIAPGFEDSGEPRFQLFVDMINAEKSVQRVLDYGSSYGWCSIYLANKTGRDFTCVDTPNGMKELFDRFRDKYARDPEKVRFYQGDHMTDVGENFDLLLVSEVLEHIPDPVPVVEALEKRVNKSGWVLITLPYGPQEAEDYDTLPFRGHVHEYDLHDIRDLFGKKPGFDVSAMSHREQRDTKEPMGWWLVKYRPDHKPLGCIDWDRKLRLQRPRQTVSVSMMVGPGAEDTLRWCLNSVRKIADEVVIADTGMSPTARAIANEFSARIVPSPSPLEIGFCGPRNIGLDECRSDWVLWIDSDERLEDPQNLDKYLRASRFDGYGVRQHHYSVDAGFQPDMPVRIFRKSAGLRFFGMIHEHPEKEMNKGPGQVVVLSDVNISHVGYTTESGRRLRFARNLPMLMRDTQVNPDRTLQKHFLIRDYMLMSMHELQSNGGKITPQIKARCEEVLKLWRENFRGHPQMANVDSLQYYSQACQWLGIGVDTSFDLQARAGDQGGNPSGKVYRFASREDLEATIKAQVEERFVPLVSEDW